MPQVLPAVAFAAFNAGAPLVVVNAILGIGVLLIPYVPWLTTGLLEWRAPR